MAQPQGDGLSLSGVRQINLKLEMDLKGLSPLLALEVNGFMGLQAWLVEQKISSKAQKSCVMYF